MMTTDAENLDKLKKQHRRALDRSRKLSQKVKALEKKIKQQKDAETAARIAVHHKQRQLNADHILSMYDSDGPQWATFAEKLNIDVRDVTELFKDAFISREIAMNTGNHRTTSHLWAAAAKKCLLVMASAYKDAD